MVTINNSQTSPSQIYNKYGMTIDTIAPNGLTAGTATVIARLCGHTVVVVGPNTSINRAVILPSGADIGDSVEVVSADGGSVYVFPPSGEGGAFGDHLVVDASVTLRKLSGTFWG
jgi:hypothetical protein